MNRSKLMPKRSNVARQVVGPRVDQRVRVDAALARVALDVGRVLVHAGQEPRLVAQQALVARDHVGADGLEHRVQRRTLGSGRRSRWSGSSELALGSSVLAALRPVQLLAHLLGREAACGGDLLDGADHVGVAAQVDRRVVRRSARARPAGPPTIASTRPVSPLQSGRLCRARDGADVAQRKVARLLRARSAARARRGRSRSSRRGAGRCRASARGRAASRSC